MTTKNDEGNVLKVISLGLEDQVYDALKKPGFSASALARQFKADGKNISAQSIRKFIKKTKVAQQAIIAKDMKVANRVMKLAMDYEKSLKDILKEVEEVKNRAKDEKDYTTYNQLIGRLMQGIELIAKLTGDIKPKGNVDINIIYNEINKDIANEMQDISKMFNKQEHIIDVEHIIKEEDKKVEKKLKEEER
jgi:hypothetical protein